MSENKKSTKKVKSQDEVVIEVKSAEIVNVPVVSKPQNVLALMSFITAFLFFIPLNSVISIILGHVALNDIKRNPNQEGEGLAKAGLVISYSLLALAVIFAMVVGFFLLLSIMVGTSLM
jgi:hypothetical protein